MIFFDSFLSMRKICFNRMNRKYYKMDETIALALELFETKFATYQQ